MDVYQEITLLNNSDISPYFIWQKLFQQIHLALAENKNSDGGSVVGVSFPEYDAGEFSLGTKLRLFAEDVEALEKLQCEKWLARLSDYVQISSIGPVPENVLGHACFSRWHEKGNFGRLARRRSKKIGVSYEEALAFFENNNDRTSSKKNHTKLPFINMQSLSGDKRFRLFIAVEDVEKPMRGTFSCYGLSGRSTVPIF